jgi:hypothetical protein
MKTLIKTNNLLILVSDEEIKEDKFIYDTADKIIVEVAEISDIGIRLTNESVYRSNNQYLKVLSQSPKLSKEVEDEIGWIDVEELIKESINETCLYDNFNKIELNTYKDGFEEGFQKANELNQKKYSEEQMFQLWVMKGGKNDKSEEITFESCISILSQPQQWACEATEEIDGVWTVTKIIK